MALNHNLFIVTERPINGQPAFGCTGDLLSAYRVDLFKKMAPGLSEAALGCSLCQVWDVRTTVAICLATRAEGLCWWRDNTGPMHKTGLASQKSSLISPMRSVSKDYMGLRWRNSGQIMRLTTATQRMWFLWILQMKRKNSLFLSLVGGGYRYYA